MSIKNDAIYMIKRAISAVLPVPNVKNAIKELHYENENVTLIAVGKAAYVMGKAAMEELGDQVKQALFVTKEGHAGGLIPHVTVIEAGHPLPNEKSVAAAEFAIDMVKDLGEKDRVLFLLSGGASALFEKPVISMEGLLNITNQLLKSGANIQEINTVRKHLSLVKGGRFAAICAPAKVDTIVLSDVLGNMPDVIGSGPTCPDKSTGEEAFSIIEKYHINLSADTIAMLMNETPKVLMDTSFRIVGDISTLVNAAKEAAESLGYQAVLITKDLSCEAREAGTMIANIARTYANTTESIAFIMGGETVVHVNGEGSGGRNQEIAFAAALGIDGLKDTCVFSVGSDGTDGPTDAAGAFVDGDSYRLMRELNIRPQQVLSDNDTYQALKKMKSLIVTGPTGTNVNDLTVLLIKR